MESIEADDGRPRRSLRAVAPRKNGTPSYDDVVQILNSTDLSQFERHQLAGALIQHACEVNGGVARRALVALYNLQTPGERAEGVSSEHNGRGFDREYGRVASELAERILGGGRLSGRDMEKTLNIVQRFRVQLVVHVDSETLRWVIEGEDGEDAHETGDAAGDATATAAGDAAATAATATPGGESAPSLPRGAGMLADDGGDDEDDDEDAEFDAADEEEDIDDFVVYSDEDADEDADEDEDDAISSDSDDVPTKRIRLALISDDEEDDDDPVVAAPAPVHAATAATHGALAPFAPIPPARRAPTREAAHAELTITEFGIRGAMMFSADTEALFQSALVQGARSADQIYEFMRGVPGLRISDVHVRLWQLRSSSAAGPSTMKGAVVVVFLDGAFRHARVVEESGSMLRLQMLAPRQGELVWVQMRGGRTLLYMEP
jgi:hypothetical protein